MPKSSNLKFSGLKDPRMASRVVIFTLLLLNVGAAIWTFKPFGGSAEDMRHEQQTLSRQLATAQAKLAATKSLVNKVETARKAGDRFLDQYFLNAGESAPLLAELNDAARTAGVRMGSAIFNREEIEGSDTMAMQITQVGFEGTYANLTKFINLMDRSPRFFIIESMSASAPVQQGGQSLSVTLKIDTFLREARVYEAGN